MKKGRKNKRGKSRLLSSIIGSMKEESRFGLRYVVLGMGITFVFLALALLPVSLLGLDPESWQTVAYAQLATGMAFILIPYLLVRRLGGGWQDLGFRSFSWMATLRWISISLIIYLVFVMIYGLLVPTEQEPIQEDFGPLVLQIFFIVILAPLSEEICFRGFLFQGLLKRFSFIPSAFLSSLLFGFLHLGSGPGAIPIITVLGMLFALLYYKTDSLWPAILLHALNNAIVLTFLTIS